VSALGGVTGSDNEARPHARLVLDTPPLPLMVPPRIFDGFAWGASTSLEVRLACPLDLDTPTLGRNPSGMAFLFLHDCGFLPRELARLHVGDLADAEEWALAPYAIDDATDELYSRRAHPCELLCLATRSLDGLVWGLHDWCHFHNHGPFDEPAWTEVQCDASALVWLWRNRARLGLEATHWEERRAQLEAVARRRFETEGLPFETDAYQAERLLSFS